MKLSSASLGFSSIGSEARLGILQILVKAGQPGLNIGDIKHRTDIPASTLAHHLKSLAAADLIRQSKQGRTIFVTANYDHLESLAGFILEECCWEQETQ